METICCNLYDCICTYGLQTEYSGILAKAHPHCTNLAALNEVLFGMSVDKLHEVLIMVQITWPSIKTLVRFCKDITPFVIQARKDARAEKSRAVFQSIATSLEKLSMEKTAPAPVSESISPQDPKPAPEQSSEPAQEPVVVPGPDSSPLDIDSWYKENETVVDQWLVSKNIVGHARCVGPYLATHGLDDLLKLYLKKYDISANLMTQTFQYAVEAGHFETVKMLRGMGYELHDSLTLSAIRGKRLDILEWLVLEGCKVNSYDTNLAAELGDLEILKWLKEKDCTLVPGAFAKAAKNRHSHILQYLLENNLPVDEDALNEVLKSGLITMKVNPIRFEAVPASGSA